MRFNEPQASVQVSLESVISTNELAVRPARPPDFEALNNALITLGRTLANAPERILQQLVDTALDLCRAHSAGISLVEEEDGREIFRWHGVAGRYAPQLWGTTPREFSPCGTVLDTDSVQLMSNLDRHFDYLANVEPRIAEALLIPFHVRGEAVGAIWVISHDQTRKFDAEDARTISTLGEFAAAAYQALSGSLTLKSVFATIRESLIVLDANFRILTASRSFYRAFRVTPVIAEGRSLFEIGGGQWNIPELRTLLADAPPGEMVFENLALTMEFPSLGRRAMSLTARKLARGDYPAGRILLLIEDITGREAAEEGRLIQRKVLRPAPGSAENIADSPAEATPHFTEFIGASASMKRVMRQIEVVAPTDAAVLILGETGTGKELIARAIHRLSSRRDLPFVSLNCAAIPTGLLESELFGYERGAFTGALSQKLGRFELANGGTLFLDEVGDIPLNLQPKLLRALQEKTFERLGATRTIAIDVRLVAATNRNLAQMMKENLFRNDLYYRLMVFPIVTPPLRDRLQDIPALVRHFTTKYAAKMGRTIDEIPFETLNALMNWSWPGNVRELENFIERSVILSRGPELEAPLYELRDDSLDPLANSYAENEERATILRVFRETRGVVSTAANILRMPRTTLSAKLKKLGISRRDL